MNTPFLFKYRPTNLSEFNFNKDINKILHYLITNNQIHLLIVGDSGTGKSTFIDCLLNTYYKDLSNKDKQEHILMINNLSEQGIVYYRTTVYHFIQSKSTLVNKKKTVILDDIDKTNDQTQQIFHSCIDKFSHKVNFILSCSNLQKINDNIQSKQMKIQLNHFDYNRIYDIMNTIILKENIQVEENVKPFIIQLSNYSIRMLINYLEKFKLYNKPIDIDTCKTLTTNISFTTFQELTHTCIYDKNINKGIHIIYGIYDNGYSVSDILDNYFIYIKSETSLTDEIKYKIINLICKYIIIFNELHEDEIELAFFINRLTKIQD